MYDKLEKIMGMMKNNQIMCMGDFNTPLSHFEKMGGNRDSPQSMQDLHEFMRKMDLIDVELRGNPFTWSNNKKGNELIQVRLDRLLVSRG